MLYDGLICTLILLTVHVCIQDVGEGNYETNMCELYILPRESWFL